MRNRILALAAASVLAMRALPLSVASAAVWFSLGRHIQALRRRTKRQNLNSG
jgi:hypothetical protein